MYGSSGMDASRSGGQYGSSNMQNHINSSKTDPYNMANWREPEAQQGSSRREKKRYPFHDSAFEIENKLQYLYNEKADFLGMTGLSITEADFTTLWWKMLSPISIAVFSVIGSIFLFFSLFYALESFSNLSSMASFIITAFSTLVLWGYGIYPGYIIYRSRQFVMVDRKIKNPKTQRYYGIIKNMWRNSFEFGYALLVVLTLVALISSYAFDEHFINMVNAIHSNMLESKMTIVHKLANILFSNPELMLISLKLALYNFIVSFFVYVLTMYLVNKKGRLRQIENNIEMKKAMDPASTPDDILKFGNQIK